MHVLRTNPNVTKELPTGTVLWFRGPGSDREKFIVSREFDGPGTYEVISTETHRISMVYASTLRPWNHSSGIGYYYPTEDKKEVINAESVNTIRTEAMRLRELATRKQEEKQKERNQRIEQGVKWIEENKPDWAHYAVVAKLQQSHSDIGADYSSYTTERFIILDWAKNHRVDFRHYKTAALNAPETQYFAPEKTLRPKLINDAKLSPENFYEHTAGGKTTKVLKIIDHLSMPVYTDVEGANLFILHDQKIQSVPELYKRYADLAIQDGRDGERYASVPSDQLNSVDAAIKVIEKIKNFRALGIPTINSEGYENRGSGSESYLGDRIPTGWQVAKVSLKDTFFLEQMSYDRNRRIPLAKSKAYDLQEDRKVIATPTVTDIELIPYSDKSFIVRGEGTRAIKDQLSNLKGTFGKFFTDPVTKEKFAGWVFSNKRRELVDDLLKNLSQTKEKVFVTEEPLKKESTPTNIIVGVNDHAPTPQRSEAFQSTLQF